MAGYASSQQTVDALNALTLQHVDRNVLYDTFFDNSPLFCLMNNGGNAVEIDGGLFLQEQFNTSSSPNAIWYASGQSWTVSEYTGFIDGSWDWCFAKDSIMVTGPQLVRNGNNDATIVNFLQAQIDVSKLSLPNMIANAMYVNNPFGTNSDGTTGNPNAIQGLAVLIDNGTISGTVGNISRAAYPTLNAQVNYAGAQGTSFLSQLQTAFTNAWAGATSQPNIILSNKSNYNYFWGLLQSNERYYMRLETLQELGYKVTGGQSLALNGAVWYVDIKCPTNVFAPGSNNTGSKGGFIYVLDSKTFKFISHPDRKFTIQQWQKDTMADNYYLDIYWAGALECIDPRRNAVLWSASG